MPPDTNQPEQKVNSSPEEAAFSARVDVLIKALDEVLRGDGPAHLFREECPCRWCYRQRALKAKTKQESAAA